MEGCRRSARARAGARRAARGAGRRGDPAARRGRVRSAFSDNDRPENLVPPTVTGDPRVGGTLSCDRGKWDDTADARYDYDFFWVRDHGEEIDGAYSSTYVVTGADAGVDLQCIVHAVNGQIDSYQESNPVTGRAPEARTAPRAERPGAPRRRAALLARRLG